MMFDTNTCQSRLLLEGPGNSLLTADGSTGENWLAGTGAMRVRRGL